MTKVLVTGGAGYIGANVCATLLRKNYQVKVIDNLSSGLVSRLEGMNIEVVNGDILDRKTLNLAMKGVDAVIHLAAKKSVEESVQNPFKYYENNFTGTLNVIGAMAAHKVPRLIFSSTAVVYASSTADSLSEEDEKKPISPYAHSKYLSEEVIKLALIAEGISSVSLRYFNVVGAGGPRLGDNARDNLIPKTFAAIKNGSTPEIYGNDYETRDGSCIRDYIHVVDLAEVHQLTLEFLDRNETSEVFNVGSGKGYTVLEMMSQIRRSSGLDFDEKICPRRSGDPQSLVANIGKISSILGWKPRLTLKEMIDSSWDAEMANS